MLPMAATLAGINALELVVLLVLLAPIAGLLAALWLRRPVRRRTRTAPVSDPTVAIGSKDADKLRPVKPRPVPDEQEAQPLVCRVCGRSSPASAVFCDRCGSAFRDAELRQQLSWDRGDIVLEVGRSESAHLQLFDATASRRHAEVTFARGALCVKDLHAVNRTRINGQLEPIQGPTLLCPGDRVHFGADVRTYDAIVSCLAAEIRQRSRQ